MKHVPTLNSIPAILLICHYGCLPFKKNPHQFGWKIQNGKNFVYHLQKNSDHGERVPFLHKERLSGAWSWQLNHRLPGIGVKNEERVNGTKRSIQNIPTGKTGLPFQTIHIFREFSSWMNPKTFFHLHSNRNFWNFLANGKQPVILKKRRKSKRKTQEFCYAKKSMQNVGF